MACLVSITLENAPAQMQVLGISNRDTSNVGNLLEYPNGAKRMRDQDPLIV
jgi:hypothetical protein